MSPEAPARPVPQVTPYLAPFFAAAREQQLVVQRCSGCGALRFPPREICSRCLSTEGSWRPVSGRGEIFSFNIMHQIYHPGFAAEVPYAVVVVRLEEGPKITSNLVGCPVDAITVGLPVEMIFERLSPEVTLPQFRPRAA